MQFILTCLIAISAIIQVFARVPYEYELMQAITDDFAKESFEMDETRGITPPSRKDIQTLIRIAYKQTGFTLSEEDLTSRIPFLTVPSLDPDAMPHTTFRKFLQEAQTGDLVLFSGNAPISLQIRRFSRSPYSHVGMVYREGEKLYLFHSTSDVSPDVRRGDATEGTQLNSIKFLQDYEGSVVWRPFSVGEDENSYRKMWTDEVINKLIDRWSGNAFPSDAKMALNYILGVLGWKKSGRINERFCSDLVTSTLIQQGYINFHALPHSFSPGELSTFSINDRFNNELFKAEYGNDHIIDF